MRKSACVSAAYWFWRIGCTEALSRTGDGSPEDRIISTAFSRGRWAGAFRGRGRGFRAGAGPSPAGRSGRALPQTKSCVRTALGGAAGEGGIARRGAGRVEQDEVGVLLGRLDEARAEAGLAEDGFEVLREQVSREVELPGPEALRDRGRREREPKLDPVETRRLLPVAGIALEDDADGRLPAIRKGPVPSGRPDLPASSGRRLRRCPSRSGQESREDRESGREAGSRSRGPPGGFDPGDVVGLSLQVLRDPEDRDEGRGHLVPGRAGSSVRGRP